MKFTCSVDIDLPLDRVVELFDNVDNLKHWQDGFISHEHVSGVPGESGTISRLIYKSGKREINLTETIVTNDLPAEFTALYEAKEMTNTMSNKFSSLTENSTRYIAEINYIKFNGIMVKLMATVFPGMFKKQVQKWLNQFKGFCERSGTIA
ncbi:MAG: SRPBCC family protein [Bacteroidetes bacterium]|nr:MAG: SRPBCC family protein [Bacteroidota bacterium]